MQSHRIIFKLKAVVCLMLMLNLSLWSLGCGSAATALFVGDQVISLTADHPLTEALSGSEFAGATAVELSHTTNQFRVIYPDGDRNISGSFATVNGQTAITSLAMTSGSKSVALLINSAKEITQIASNEGATWQRPASWNSSAPGAPSAPSAPSAATAKTSLVDEANAFVQANAQLLDLAAEIDAESDGDLAVGKAGQSSLFWAVALWSLILVPGGIHATLLFIIQLLVVLGIIP